MLKGKDLQVYSRKHRRDEGHGPKSIDHATAVVLMEPTVRHLFTVSQPQRRFDDSGTGTNEQIYSQSLQGWTRTNGCTTVRTVTDQERLRFQNGHGGFRSIMVT